MCSIAHTSASQGQRQGCCFLICSVLTHHLQSVNSSWKSFVPVCVCVGVSALVSYPICTINKESMQEHKHLPCHQPQESVSGKKEKEKKKLHVFTKAGAWIAVWNSTEPSSHYCFLFLRTEATTFLYPYHMCLVMICTGDVQKMMFQHALASRAGIRSSV